jgi:NAD(P)-dependent dehydrogenase (short-subunit alcohol dehydrogenase family)
VRPASEREKVPQRFDLTDKAAIVTGASSGLGRHFAATLAQAGAKVAVMARRTDRLTKLCREIEAAGGRAVPIALDVADGASVRQAVASAATALGPISILVNNAGMAITRPALEVSEQEWDQVMGVNLRGAWLMAQETARHMQRVGQGGSIVNIASVAGLRVAGQLSTYGASKAALAHLTGSLALELARHKIRVNGIAPGYIETEINRDFFQTEAGKKLIGRIPQRRLGTPADLDGVLLLLASDASSFMTGSVVVVDGGQMQSSL